MPPSTTPPMAILPPAAPLSTPVLSPLLKPLHSTPSPLVRATSRVPTHLPPTQFRTKPRRLIYRPPLELIVLPKLFSLSDTSPTPTIYYTTDGTKPNHNSPQYSKPISVTSTATINAIASSPGLNDSPARNSDVYDRSECHHNKLRHGFRHADRSAIQRVHRLGR